MRLQLRDLGLLWVMVRVFRLLLIPSVRSNASGSGSREVQMSPCVGLRIRDGDGSMVMVKRYVLY